MAKEGKRQGRSELQAVLARLTEARSDPSSEESLRLLREALASDLPAAVTRAARFAAEFELAPLARELTSAFARLMEHPVKRDPGCQAKLAIADALYKLEASEESVFLRGIRHVQMEAAYGPPVDTASNLRAVCALGLVRMNHPQALVELGDLLADRETPARLGAARALGYSENEQAAPVLRVRVLSGEPDFQVLAECLASLVAVDREGSLEFLERLLDAADPAVAESAALALGASRSPRALEMLRRWWEASRSPALRRCALLSIATLRLESSLEFLLSLVARSPGPEAREAIAALALYEHDEAVRERVLHLAATREDAKLDDAAAEVFGR